MFNMNKFKNQSVITPWDRLKKFVFESYPVVEIHTNDMDKISEIAKEHQGKSDFIWLVDPYIKVNENFPWHFRPSDEMKNYIHMFPNVIQRTGSVVGWGHIKLVPTDIDNVQGTVKNRIKATYNETTFDVVMISYHEAEADQNFQKLKLKYPDAKHVKNVKGIGNAHKEAAAICDTEMVYIVDADADVLESFNFDFIPPMSKRDNTTYVWAARNPINGLEYGFGGIKLFPRKQLLEMGHELPDFTAGVSFYQPISNVACVTRFNKDPFRTWRSAFRECAKLASGIQQSETPKQQTIDRLEGWTTVDNGSRFGRYCIKGALEGKAYGEEFADNVEELNKINDFDWLRERFVESMKKRISADDE